MYTLDIDVHTDESHVVVLDETDEIADEVRACQNGSEGTPHHHASETPSRQRTCCNRAAATDSELNTSNGIIRVGHRSRCPCPL
jgi:hypothetical protein